MIENSKIIVKKQDILPYIYFVCSMAQQSKNGMHGALSTKTDMIGGIFDRWINIIPESISFNKYFIPKAQEKINSNLDIKVVSDFFIYEPKDVGIAPDVFGLKINNKIIPFVKYNDCVNSDNYWIPQTKCPQIEIKSFFGNKYMVSLRDQHYENKFLVMIEADLCPDYLLPFFNQSLFTNANKKLEMSNDFIVNNNKKLLTKTSDVNFENDTLGYLKILTVTTANKFKNFALKLHKGDIPRFFKSIEERNTYIKEEKFEIKKELSFFVNKNNQLFRFNNEWYKLFSTPNEYTLDIAIQHPDKIQIIRKNKNAIVILALDNAEINGQFIEKGKQYNINFDTFGTIAGEEYFINKCVIKYLENEEEQLLNNLSNIIKENS